jgi:hypothetical protein
MILIFVIIVATKTKKGRTTNFFHPSLLLLFLDPGSEIRDPEFRNGQKTGSGIHIPDPQHCLKVQLSLGRMTTFIYIQKNRGEKVHSPVRYGEKPG